MTRPSPLSMLLGAVVLTAAPVLLLRAMFSDFGSGEPTVWLNPNHVSAGFGFAGLLLALAVGALVHRARGLPWDQGSAALAAVVVVGGLGGWVAHRPLVGFWASHHGYQRCQAGDRFHAGNVKRNDVTLQAWALQCHPAPGPRQ